MIGKRKPNPKSTIWILINFIKETISYLSFSYVYLRNIFELSFAFDI